MSFKQNIGDSVISGDFSKLEKLVKNLGKKFYVDIGILGGATYEGGATIAGIGAVHELGSETRNIKARSFIKMPLIEKEKQITQDVEKHLPEKLANGDIKGIFKILGLAGENAIQEAFETGGFGTWPDIEQATKDRKGSDSILIDQGDLRKAVTSKVGRVV